MDIYCGIDVLEDSNYEIDTCNAHDHIHNKYVPGFHTGI